MSKSSVLRAKARQTLGGKIFGKAWLMALLVCLVIVVASMVSGIPLIGSIACFVISGPIYVGVYGYFLKLTRGEEPEFKNVL